MESGEWRVGVCGELGMLFGFHAKADGDVSGVDVVIDAARTDGIRDIIGM